LYQELELAREKENMHKNLKLSLILIMLCFAAANATTLVVLEITAANDEMDLGIDETKFLTDELRRQAARFLPMEYSVLTRDKIISSIPKSAENLTSVVALGVALKGDYVTRSFIGKLGNLFTLTVELYEVAGGNMLGDFVKESTDLKGLLDAIRENSPNLFAKIKAPITTNLPAEPKKTKTPFWVATCLDVLGAAALGFGIYSNAKSNDYYKESKNLLNDIPPEQYDERKSEFDAKYKKMQDAKSNRNIFYATGSVLLLSGIAVHIWF
jgi:hypothetical protein